ncbi:hypothetical protein GYMLUDRAFT_51178 [Collybiopsis luxurians FD-317 M1]|uniref:Unplaced genomic scaffold GYMLUscaffold_153, whole genome shotgun sequence n=1 Tax=Collybiopsis luxurians FD-317 M1 TaxID=944289 RepID=A0A0D0C6Z0_9AGAR|nr:hypothetical protein GYMLUDRAFT_51178 [Collybiopsis luxurians FD-317 M1]
MPRPDGPIQCSICNAVINRKQDFPRHMRIHNENRDSVVFKCPWPGCTYDSLQRSNVETHYRIHTQDKSKACPNCDFAASDPSSLTRHRKRHHGYQPKPRGGGGNNASSSGQGGSGSTAVRFVFVPDMMLPANATKLLPDGLGKRFGAWSLTLASSLLHGKAFGSLPATKKSGSYVTKEQHDTSDGAHSSAKSSLRSRIPSRDASDAVHASISPRDEVDDTEQRTNAGGSLTLSPPEKYHLLSLIVMLFQFLLQSI